jgi:hypothetical protein
VAQLRSRKIRQPFGLVGKPPTRTNYFKGYCVLLPNKAVNAGKGPEILGFHVSGRRLVAAMFVWYGSVLYACPGSPLRVIAKPLD